MLERLGEKFKDHLVLGATLLTSAAIQLSFISRSSIWHDEGYSLLLAPQNLADILTRTARDVHPPLYYLALHFWTNLFGTSELAARSLSVVAILGVMTLMFFIVRWLFGHGAARLSLVFMALAPFLIRYGQEARMYALVAFLLTLATYLLVRTVMTHHYKLLYLYGLVMALAFYTHYYTIFMIAVHWAYVIIQSIRLARGHKPLIKNIHWWAGNILTVGLFLPWLPIAYKQFTRVQGGFWISPVDATTLPGTLENWLRFNHFHVASTIRVGAGILLLGLIAATLIRDRVHTRRVLLLAMWALAAPFAVFVVSALSRPVYVDRYFVFAAVSFYALLAVLFYLRPLNRYRILRAFLALGLISLFISGIQNVYLQSNHQMRTIGQTVSLRFNPGDEVVAGELYVYLDFSYYNKTGQSLKLYAPGGVSGYGETSLLYDHPELVINDWTNLNPSSGYIWVIGKAGEKDYFKNLPAHWQLVEQYQAGDSVARRYLTSAHALAAAN